MKSFVLKLLRQIVIVFAAVWLGYLVLINGLLFTKPLAFKLINLHPEIVQIHYDRAYSPFPFRFRLTNLELAVEDGNIQIFITADTAGMDIEPWTLFDHKRFFGTHTRGTGLTFRMRQRLMPNEATPDKLAKIPPIPGFQTAMRDHAPGPPITDAEYNLVTVEMPDMLISDLHDVWVNEYHFIGHLDVVGGFYYKPMRKLRIDPQTEIHIRDGQLDLGGTRQFVKNINAELGVSVDMMDVNNPELEYLKGMSIYADLAMDVSSVGFLNYYLKKVPQVRFEQGSGSLKVKANVEKGEIKDGSTLSLDTSRVQVQLPYFKATGIGNIRWKADKKIAKLDVNVHDIDVTQDSDGASCLKGPSLRILADSSSLDLTQPIDLDTVIDLEEAEAKDLRFLNNYIPDGAGVKISGGSGRIHGNLEIDAKKQHARGALSIDGVDVGIVNRGAKMKGKATIRGTLVDLDLKTGDTNLSGSSIALDKVQIDVDGRHDEDFWVRVSTSHCRLEPAKHNRWEATMDLGLKNLMPIVGIVSANISVPWVVKAFSNLSDVKAHAQMLVTPNTIVLTDLGAGSGILRVEGDMTILDPPGQDSGHRQTYGALLLNVGQLTIGLELKGNKVDRFFLVPAIGFIRTEMR